MAGTNPAFPADQFIAGIKLAMAMGQPENAAEALSWHWRPEQTFTEADTAGDPYDYGDTPVTDAPGNAADPTDVGIIVDYALEFAVVGATDTSVGQIDPSKATVTLLGAEYDRVKTADYAIIDGSHYDIDFSAPPQGLFNVTVYSVQLTARDA